MKKLLLTLFASIIAQGAFAESKTACFTVEGMTCAACTVTTKAAIKKLDGIESISVSLDDKKAEVHYNDAKTNLNEIKNKIESIGYSAEPSKCQEERSL
ncbi:MAG: heavy-metal-associated domain-containing protein [Bacteriovoracaceae bacterium]|jgi:mercuric ion binding protein